MEIIPIALLGIGLASFLLGYTAAESRERAARRTLDQHLKATIREKHNLSRWVRQNWPNEYAAYKRGHGEGYQQGVLQAAELEDT